MHLLGRLCSKSWSLLLFWPLLSQYVFGFGFFTDRSEQRMVTIGDPILLTWDSGGARVNLTYQVTLFMAERIRIASGLTTENYTWTPPGDIPLGIFWINLEGSSAEDFQVVNLVARSTASSSAPSELSAAQTSSQSTSIAKLSPSPTSLQTSTTIIPPSASTETLSPQTSSLSTGTKAGIGIGTTFGVLLMVGLIVFAFLYGKRSAARKFISDKTAMEIEKENIHTFERAELDARARGSSREWGRAGSVEGVKEVAELDGTNSRLAEIG